MRVSFCRGWKVEVEQVLAEPGRVAVRAVVDMLPLECESMQRGELLARPDSSVDVCMA